MKIAIVTGASRGLGASIAKGLAGAGCNVVVNYAASSGAADEVVASIKAEGGQAVALKADVSKVDEVNSLVQGALAAFPDDDIEVLVNNAGITRDTLVMRMKPEQWQQVIDLNLSGVFYCSQAVSKLMIKKRKGHIVNIASIVGQIGNPGQANYAAAKGGVIGMTRSMAKEFSSRGITVNAVCPGFIESDMTAELDLESIKKIIPLGRLGKPEEVAGMVRYLATDASSCYVTGHTFNVDGGLAIGC
ncbi:unnamed protein product [Discosporangium mesarthrocarpum]